MDLKLNGYSKTCQLRQLRVCFRQQQNILAFFRCKDYGNKYYTKDVFMVPQKLGF